MRKISTHAHTLRLSLTLSLFLFFFLFFIHTCTHSHACTHTNTHTHTHTHSYFHRKLLLVVFKPPPTITKDHTLWEKYPFPYDIDTGATAPTPTPTSISSCTPTTFSPLYTPNSVTDLIRHCPKHALDLLPLNTETSFFSSPSPSSPSSVSPSFEALERDLTTQCLTSSALYVAAATRAAAAANNGKKGGSVEKEDEEGEGIFRILSKGKNDRIALLSCFLSPFYGYTYTAVLAD